MSFNVKEKNKNLTIPNAISLVRLLMVPFFAYSFLNGHLAVAVLLLVLSGLSDLVDGWIARRFNQITELGKILDPLADKVTQGTVALCLAIKYPSIRIFLIFFMCKELFMLICAAVLLHRKKKPCAAMWFGKVSTALFYISVTAVVFMHTFSDIPPETIDRISTVLLVITFISMLYAAIRYFFIFLNIMRSDDKEYSFDLKSEITDKRK